VKRSIKASKVTFNLWSLKLTFIYALITSVDSQHITGKRFCLFCFLGGGGGQAYMAVFGLEKNLASKESMVNWCIDS